MCKTSTTNRGYTFAKPIINFILCFQFGAFGTFLPVEYSEWSLHHRSNGNPLNNDFKRYFLYFQEPFLLIQHIMHHFSWPNNQNGFPVRYWYRFAFLPLLRPGKGDGHFSKLHTVVALLVILRTTIENL